MPEEETKKEEKERVSFFTEF